MAKKEAPKQDPLDAILAKVGPVPAPASQQKAVNFFGPPAGYYAQPGFQQGMQPGFVPFQEGDQYGPAFDPPEVRARLQAKMNALGLYGDKGYRPGVWSGDDAKAYGSILETANASGIANPEEALDRYAQQVAVTSPKVKAPRAPLVTRYADPESVRQVVQDSAQKMTGQFLPDADVQGIVSAYQGYTAQAQRNQYAATDPEGAGGSYTQPMAPEDYARTAVEKAAPTQVGAHHYLDAFEGILGAMGTMAKAPDLYGSG